MVERGRDFLMRTALSLIASCKVNLYHSCCAPEKCWSLRNFGRIFFSQICLYNFSLSPFLPSMFIPTICNKDLLFEWLLLWLKERCTCEGFLLFRWLFSINRGWRINTIDSWSKCPVSRSRLLNRVSQIMHQCLSNWKQVNGECTLFSYLVLSSFGQEGIDAICMWSFRSVKPRSMCLGEVDSFSPTGLDSACANWLDLCFLAELCALLPLGSCIGGMWRRMGNFWEM